MNAAALLGRHAAGQIIERRHPAHGLRRLRGIGHFRLDGGGHDARAERLGQHQHVARPGAGGAPHGVALDLAEDAETVFWFLVFDAVPPHQERAAFGHFGRAAFHEALEHVQRQAVEREGDDVEGHERRAAHGEDVADRIGGGDLPPHIRIVDDRRDEIEREDADALFGNLPQRRVLASLPVGEDTVVAGTGEIRQNFCQVLRTYFGGSAAAVGKLGQSLVKAHFRFAPVVKLLYNHYTAAAAKSRPAAQRRKKRLTRTVRITLTTIELASGK